MWIMGRRKGRKKDNKDIGFVKLWENIMGDVRKLVFCAWGGMKYVYYWGIVRKGKGEG